MAKMLLKPPMRDLHRYREGDVHLAVYPLGVAALVTGLALAFRLDSPDLDRWPGHLLPGLAVVGLVALIGGIVLRQYKAITIDDTTLTVGRERFDLEDLRPPVVVEDDMEGSTTAIHNPLWSSRRSKYRLAGGSQGTGLGQRLVAVEHAQGWIAIGSYYPDELRQALEAALTRNPATG